MPFQFDPMAAISVTRLDARHIRVEHRALDGPITISAADPGFLDTEARELFHEGMERTDMHMAVELIDALARFPGISLHDAESLVDIWEAAAFGEYSHLDVGPIDNA